MNFSCNVTEEGVIGNASLSYNVSVYYNMTGDEINFLTGDLLYVQSYANQSIPNNGSIFENVTVDISTLTDARGYNFTCYFDNGSNQLTNSVNITIDNTPPNVSAFVVTTAAADYSNATDNWNYTNNADANLLAINVSVSDATVGMSRGFVDFNFSFSNGTQRNITRATNYSAGGYFNYTINISDFPDGTYYIYAQANDSLGNLNRTEYITVKFDKTAPVVTFNTGALGNFSGTVVLNISSDDATIGTGDAYFNITNSTYGQHNFTKGSSIDGTNWNISLNTVLFPDGNYTLIAYTNDTQVGNQNNSESINFTIDNTAPNTPSFSCTPSQVYTGQGVTCVCSGTDGATGVNETVFTASPSTSNTGTFVETCTIFDRAGNSKSTTTSYVVEQTPSGGSGGGGGTTTQFYTKTISRLEQEFSEIKTVGQELREKQRVRVKINDETHYVGVKKVITTSATIEIASDPVQIILDIGEDAKVDINENNFYDIYVKLNSITNGYADLTINYLHEEIPEPEEGEDASSVDTSGEIVEPEIEEEETSNLIWWIVGIVIVILIIVIVFIVLKKRNG